MSSGPVRQASFAGGEVSPLFYGNTGHPRYRSALRKLLNFIALPHGPVQNRPGTRFTAHTKADGKILLVPFVFSSTQTYVLEFGNLYVRFYSAGGQLVTGAPPLPYEVATPFTAAMLPYLKFTQSADVMTIDYGGQATGVAAVAPQELRRLGHTNWTIAPVGFAALAAPTFSVAPFLIVSADLVPDATHPGEQWAWRLTQFLRESATGNVFETAPFDVALPAYDNAHAYSKGDVVIFGDTWQTYTSLQNANTGHQPDTDVAAAAGNWARGVMMATDKLRRLNWTYLVRPGYSIVGTAIYRGRNGVFGLVTDQAGNNGSTGAGLFGFIFGFFLGFSHFDDDGRGPNYAVAPPASTDPFALTDDSGSVTGHDYPSVPAFFEQRRLFARQGLHAQRIQGSKIGQYSNFDKTVLTQSNDAISLDLAATELEEIRSLVPLHAVFVLTQSGIWTLRGYQGQALGPTSENARKQLHSAGASWVTPARVIDAILYEQDGGGAVWDFSYNSLYDVGSGSDVSVWGQHLLEGHAVVQMAYAARPFKVVWIVRDDGVLLGLTYLRSQDPQVPSVIAWHQHQTAGVVESVAVVPEGTEDAVYLAVLRNGGRFVERMATRVLPQIADGVDSETGLSKFRPDVRFAVYLDASLQFDGRNTSGTTMLVTGASYNADDIVTVQASAASFAVTDVGDQVVIDPDGTPTRITVTAFTDATHVSGRLGAPLPAANQNAATTSWGWARDTVTGLGHLEGQTVSALVDGVVQGPFVVAGGQVALDPPGLIAQVGLPYNSDLELLDIASDAVKPNVKSVARAIFEVVASRGIFAGQSFDRLRPAKTRKVTDNFGAPALVTDQVAVDTDGDWNTGGRAVFRQSDPLPLTVTAVIRELVVGGRG